MKSVAELLQGYLHHVIYDPEHAFLDVEQLPKEFQELGSELVYFCKCLMETTALAQNIAKGNLEVDLPPPENEMAGPLKALHASLKHLTWRAQQVAKGDYQQHLDFMGEFAEAFNAMKEQLEYQRRNLLKEIEDGHEKTQALEQSNSLLQIITNQISQWIIVMDVTTSDWLYVNQQAAQILKDPDYESKWKRWMKWQADALEKNGQPYFTEMKISQGDKVQYFSVDIHPLSWYGNKALVFMFTDVSYEKEQLYDLQNAAYTDIMTQAFNRRYGMKILHEWLVGSRSFVLCFIDIDRLKSVNDTFGHSEGDRYILEVTGILHNFSLESVLCRMGGDEFMILAQDWNAAKAKERMEVLRNRLINGDFARNHSYERSISYGVVEVRADNLLSESALLSIADERMYEYKKAYRMKHKKINRILFE
ncbi:sensor domain-containing diguanylate cyclase [Aminipila luticellarii]|uniref:Diguanylate cyclase n=1 Tax=Aminipila luticellarii TaxID=2507160 RepID=A0A410PWD3_9FIRM|nr:diguanylate cyclase [Aminipila luticellarii]QAT43252.1 diguanylate cyclase [Aminipila luticellarii]